MWIEVSKDEISSSPDSQHYYTRSSTPGMQGFLIIYTDEQEQFFLEQEELRKEQDKSTVEQEKPTTYKSLDLVEMARSGITAEQMIALKREGLL